VSPHTEQIHSDWRLLLCSFQTQKVKIRFDDLTIEAQFVSTYRLEIRENPVKRFAKF
jgi:hypothetical protein